MNDSKDILELNEIWSKTSKLVILENIEKLLSTNGCATFNEKWNKLMEITDSAKYAVYAWLNRGRTDVKIPFLKLCMVAKSYDIDVLKLLIGENYIMEKMKLRVWWIPQVGCGSTFFVPVENVFEAKKVIDTLSAYDAFQLNNNIKPDYCNTGGLQMWDEKHQEWINWYYEDENNYFDNINEYIETTNNAEKLKEFSNKVLSQVTFKN